MKITLRPDPSLRSIPDNADKFLESLKLDPEKWDQEQFTEFEENNSLKVFGMDVFLTDEEWLLTEEWIWKFEVIDGSNRFFINQKLVVADVLKSEEDPNAEKAIGSLPASIRYLCLANLAIKDLGPISRLRSLTNLNLSGCESLRDIGPISGLTSLTNLSLSRCKTLSDLGPISELSSMMSLDLNWCHSLSNLGPISGLSSLTSLNLALCVSLCDLGPISGLNSLTSLDVRW